jgi:hypothetical protein
MLYRTARIAAALALVPFLVCMPAHALSLKDWEAKPALDQLDYLRICIAELIGAVGQTDKPLAQRIYSYYSDKPPSLKYPQGTIDLFTAIDAAEKTAKAAGTDLSKIELEDVVLRLTTQKFSLPATVATAFKDSGAATVTRKSAPAKPAASAGSPVMVGKIDVSHFAGLKPGDGPQQVVAIYGQPTEDHRTYQWWGKSSGPFMVSYVNNAIKTMEAYSAAVSLLRDRTNNDPLVALIGQKEPAVVALLGPPKDEEEDEADTYNLFWAFPMAGNPAPQYANLASDQTLTLRFRRINPPTRQHGIRQDDADCIWVSVTW